MRIGPLLNVSYGRVSSTSRSVIRLSLPCVAVSCYAVVTVTHVQIIRIRHECEGGIGKYVPSPIGITSDDKWVIARDVFSCP